MHINYKLIIIFSGLISTSSFANVADLKVFESQLIANYNNTDFYDVNIDLEEKISNFLAQDQSSFQYNFPRLQDLGYIDIKYSPDRKLKFYTFDIGGGGTMGEYSSYVQYKQGNQIKFDIFESGYISEVDQIQLNNHPVYLIKSFYKGDSCNYAPSLRAVQSGKNMLEKSYIFLGKNNKNHSIDIAFNCHQSKSPYEQPQDYLKVSHDKKYIDVMLLNEKYIPQNKFLRYSRSSEGYKYIGIVKP